jgi:hypothetical protein
MIMDVEWKSEPDDTIEQSWDGSASGLLMWWGERRMNNFI